jgi:hypothetical protein
MKPTYQCQYLRGRRLRTFLAVANRIIPPASQQEGAGTMATAGILDWSLANMAPALRRKILLLLTVIEFLGFFFGGGPFSRNSQGAQDKVLRWLENNRIGLLRMGFFGIMTFVKMSYYTREDVWKSIHYPGPILPERNPPDEIIRSMSQRKMEVLP